MRVTGRRAAEEAPHRRAVLDIAEVVGEVVTGVEHLLYDRVDVVGDAGPFEPFIRQRCIVEF